MADQTEVGLRRAVLVSEQDTHRVAHGTSSGASGEPVWTLVAGKASPPRGSTVNSRHGQESTENGRPPCAQKCTWRQWRERARDGECPVLISAATSGSMAPWVRFTVPSVL